MANKSIDWHSKIALDLLRGVAAFSVMLTHVRGASFVAYGALPHADKTKIVSIFFALTRLGIEPVLIFFVLSGFLVGGQIIRRVQAGTFKLGEYAIARATRIFVPLWPSVLLTACVIVYLGGHVGPLAIIANMLGFNDLLAPTLLYNAPLWSLVYEIWFYISGGALACLLVSRGPGGAGKLISVLVLTIALIVFAALGEAYLLYWWFGALAVTLVQWRSTGFLFLLGFTLVGLGTVLSEMGRGGISLATIHYVSQDIAAVILAAGIALAIPYLCSDAVQKKLFSMRHLASALASISYTLYLIHYPVNSVLDHVFAKATTINIMSCSVFALRAAICTAVAYLWWFMFERNTQWVRVHLRKSGRHGSVDAAAPERI